MARHYARAPADHAAGRRVIMRLAVAGHLQLTRVCPPEGNGKHTVMERKQNAVAISGAFLAQAAILAAIAGVGAHVTAHQAAMAKAVPVPVPNTTFLVPGTGAGPAPSFDVGVGTLPWVSLAGFSPLGSPQSFVVTPGENLTITVGAMLPGPALTNRSLWLGVASGVSYSSPAGPSSIGTDVSWPETINGPGPQWYTVTWTVPTSLPPGAVKQLVVDTPDGGGVIATFEVAS